MININTYYILNNKKNVCVCVCSEAKKTKKPDGSYSTPSREQLIVSVQIFHK